MARRKPPRTPSRTRQARAAVAGPASDGVAALLLAVASTARGVTVDLSKAEPRTTPPNLLGRRFGDARVGLTSAAHMAALRAALARLLPRVAGTLDNVPLTPSTVIGDAAGAINTLLSSTTEAPLPQAPTVMSLGPTGEARKKVQDRWGTALASKSSDALLRRLTAPVRERFGEAVTTAMSGLVLEFTEQQPDAVLAERAASRTQRLASMRDAFYRSVTPVRIAIERAAGSPAVQICWLNSTVRVQGEVGTVASVADHNDLQVVDVSRRLRREMNIAAVTVALAAARTTFRVTGKGVRVAVIDGEVFTAHPALAGRVTAQENFTSEPFGSPDPHGTAVAGIIAAADARFGGIAPEATILNYKVFPTGATEGDEFQGLLAVEHALRDGADIANCSWGIGPAGDGTDRNARAFNKAWQEGLILIKSAGNAGPDADTMTSPADADGVVVVGATEREGRTVQDYSSRGPTLNGKRPHLVAPGGNDAANMVTCLAAGGFGDASFGTSFAAPVVAGAAALLRQQFPTATPDDIRTHLLAMCRSLAVTDANASGAGLVDLARFSV